jgi:hypothetical protein
MKGFYQFISESNDNLYYEIDVIEWRNNTIKNEYVDYKFVQGIEEFLKTLRFEIVEHIPKDEKSIFIYRSSDGDYLTLRKIISTIHICITKDEWYYVKNTKSRFQDEHFYKCDQYDGLIKCLTDILK